MADVTPKGLVIWDLLTDQFNHEELADNFELIDTLLDTPPNKVETLAAVPGSSNFDGRLVYLSAAHSGFPAKTLIRYDGSAWRAVGPHEILSAVPVTGNYAGRLVVLSSASGAFSAWDIILYDGSTWNLLGVFGRVNTGGGAANIQGAQISGDVYVNTGARGVVLVDRTTGTKYRLYIDNGGLHQEVVT